MAKNIIVLGAGASAHLGSLVTSDFLDVARTLSFASGLETHAKSFANVFSAISNLQAVHSKSELDLINIESIFAVFELSKTLQSFPGRSISEIDILIADLKRLIVITLERTGIFPFTNGIISGHAPYAGFLEHALINRPPDRRPSLAFLTFNYDVILDVAFACAGAGAEYALDTPVHAQPAVPLLKLHGSINWAKEVEGGTITPWPIMDFLYAMKSHAGYDATGLRIGSNITQLSKFSNSGKQVEELPVIVPPSWNDTDSHRSLSAVWARAARELAEAESIFIIGYSLPQTDAFFRQLYALGSISNVMLKRFWVFNPDPSREEVFHRLLGPGARPRFRFFEMKLEEALNVIASELERDTV